RIDRCGEQVGAARIAGLVAIKASWTTMPCQGFSRCAQDWRHARIIRHDESRQELCHIPSAAPLIPREQADGNALLVQQLPLGGKTQNDLPALRLVETGKIIRIQLDFPIRDWQLVARDQAVNRPDLLADERWRS